MDRQAALSIYIKAASQEREKYLYEQTLKKARALTAGMKPAEREEYLRGTALSNALYHMKRRDRAFQAMQRGELVLDYHIVEFEQLAPLIESELAHGSEVSLDFLRSVQRSRVTLQKAHAALRQLELNAPRKTRSAQLKRFAGEAEGRVERCLKKGDLSRFVKRNQHYENVVDHVMDTAFARGVPDEASEAP